MNRLVSFGRRSFTTGIAKFAEAKPNTSAATSLVLNFVTPHQPIYTKKNIDKVILPGEAGEYGVTMNHSPVISQLKPGVVTVIHSDNKEEKFFVPGGFAITHANSVTDVSVTEAVPLNELDESSIKSGYSAAVSAASSAAAGSVAQAKAQIEVNVYSSLARAVGIAL